MTKVIIVGNVRRFQLKRWELKTKTQRAKEGHEPIQTEEKPKHKVFVCKYFSNRKKYTAPTPKGEMGKMPFDFAEVKARAKAAGYTQIKMGCALVNLT